MPFRNGDKENRVKGFERKIILDNFLIGKISMCQLRNTVFIRSGMQRETKKESYINFSKSRYKEKISIGLI